MRLTSKAPAALGRNLDTLQARSTDLLQHLRKTQGRTIILQLGFLRPPQVGVTSMRIRHYGELEGRNQPLLHVFLDAVEERLTAHTQSSSLCKDALLCSNTSRNPEDYREVVTSGNDVSPRWPARAAKFQANMGWREFTAQAITAPIPQSSQNFHQALVGPGFDWEALVYVVGKKVIISWYNPPDMEGTGTSRFFRWVTHSQDHSVNPDLDSARTRRVEMYTPRRIDLCRFRCCKHEEMAVIARPSFLGRFCAGKCIGHPQL
ncbi:hypothetical protein I7I51_04404 [Histoplasma capsulatum]|uniref:Uncharacterized protein n=1 Tax=Ajellomyces capsulatus TaxID=5037 RepID=A0A8A1MDJ3_AJECA|nr:hypothetical protein I7I51_04404 [Histoplasma capsulatum]